MQVAAMAARSALTDYHAQGVAASVSVHTRITVNIQQAQPSVGAMWAMKYIADSTRLSGSEKRSLIHLVAFADQFAGGDLKLMQKIVALAKVMEMDAREGQYKRHSMQQVMDEYWRDREAMGQEEPSVSVSAETEIEATFAAYDVHGTKEITQAMEKMAAAEAAEVQS